MLCVWVHGRDPGRVSDAWLAAGTISNSLSIKGPSPIFFWRVLCVVAPFVCSFCFLFVFVRLLELCRCSSDMLLTDRASTIPSNIRGCQSGTWSAGQEKIGGASIKLQ